MPARVTTVAGIQFDVLAARREFLALGIKPDIGVDKLEDIVHGMTALGVQKPRMVYLDTIDEPARLPVVARVHADEGAAATRGRVEHPGRRADENVFSD